MKHSEIPEIIRLMACMNRIWWDSVMQEDTTISRDKRTKLLKCSDYNDIYKTHIPYDDYKQLCEGKVEPTEDLALAIMNKLRGKNLTEFLDFCSRKQD